VGVYDLTRGNQAFIKSIASPRARAFTNYWGLTPCCDSSGESERLGHISKDGSPIGRFLLGQLVLHMLRRDPGLKRWYQSVQKRRGTKIARVAVMRKLAASIWHMVRYHEPYRLVHRRDRHGVPPARSTPPARPESHPSAAWSDCPEAQAQQTQAFSVAIPHRS
jgi:hypothetical protein